MNSKLLIVPIVSLFLAVIIISSENASGKEPKLFIPDKALCAKMIRFGKEAYQRGKHLDAKEYFRKAVQADPTSSVAWRYYDQSVISALAEKVKKDPNLILPDASAPPSASQAPSKPEPTEEDTKFKIVEDEGC